MDRTDISHPVTVVTDNFLRKTRNTIKLRKSTQASTQLFSNQISVSQPLIRDIHEGIHVLKTKRDY